LKQDDEDDEENGSRGSSKSQDANKEESDIPDYSKILNGIIPKLLKYIIINYIKFFNAINYLINNDIYRS
jgi:hypothetical protein